MIIIMSREFFHLFFLSVTFISFGFYVMGSFKSYGQTYIADDEFLTYIGSVGSLLNGFSRIFYSTLLDYYSFKKVFGFLVIL